MKEYTILIKNGSAQPYMLESYRDIESAKKAIQNIIDFEEERHRMYFVDNDYFNNKYCLVGSLKYLCIYEREVTEYSKYIERIDNNISDGKVIYLNFKK